LSKLEITLLIVKNKILKVIILVKEIARPLISELKPGTIVVIKAGAKIIIKTLKIKIIKKRIFKIEFVVCQAFFLSLAQTFKKTGIKAEEKAPKTKVLKTKSGKRKAAR